MAKLYECSTCGGKVSKNAKICPHCGEDGVTKLTAWQKLKRATIWAIIILVLLGYGINKLGTFLDENRENQRIVSQSNAKIAQFEAKQKLAQKVKDEKKEKALEPKKDALLTHMKSSKEPKTKDAVWNDTKHFYVAVYDNGTNRNGYAEYVCQVAYDKGLKGEEIYVKVVDFAKVLKKQGFVKLGEAFCN